MTWQMYWKKPFQFTYAKDFDHDFHIFYNLLVIGPLQMRWYSSK